MKEIIFYKTEKGKVPLRDFLARQNAKVRAKFEKLFDILEKEETPLGRPFVDNLRDGIKELRIIFAGSQYRALHFFFHKNYIVFTHGYIKKTDKVPEEEIERAIRYKNDFESRHGR